MRAGRVFTWAMLAMWPAGAQALICEPPSLAGDFWGKQASADIYEAVFGSFTELRNRNHDIAGDVVTWQATFTGFRASSRAFDKPLTTEVTISYPLLSDIAGADREPPDTLTRLQGMEGVVFLRQTPEGYVATVDVCSPFIYTDPADVTTALDCLNGRTCPRD
jgi:hypothetical protein